MKKKMAIRLKPHDEKLWQEALRDLNKAEDDPSSTYSRVTLPEPASKSEIRAIRKALAVTQWTFAQLVGVSLETVKAWEAGKRVPEGPASKLMRLLMKRPSIASVLE
jgi:putative transcriptional regulator